MEGKAQVIFEGSGSSFVYRYPPADLKIKIRLPKIHSDGRLTALLRFESEEGGRIPSSGVVNLSAPRTRMALATSLEEQWPTGVWPALLDDLYQRLESALLEGDPAEPIAPDAETLEMPYLVYPLLPLDMPTIFYGPGGVGKGWLALLIAKAVMTGQRPRGLNIRIEETGPVLYLDWESCRADLHARWTRVARNESNDVQLLYRKCSGPLAHDLEYIQGVILECDPVLVIIDSAALASGADLNSVESATELFRAVRELRRTVLLIAHSPKHANSVYGSVYFTNLARMVWEVRSEPKERENELVIGLACRKSNVGPLHKPFGLLLRFTDEGLETAPADLQATSSLGELEGREKRIISFLEHEGKSTVEEIAASLGLAKTTVQNYLYKLRREGHVAKFENKWGLLEEVDIPF